MEISEAMQEQGKAIADPSRFKLFRHIGASADPVGVAELTELLGFNHNAIRQHLAVLVNAGLIVEFDEERTRRGRPRKQYQIRADALNAFRSVSGAYQQLSELLLEVAVTGDSAYDVGYRSASAHPLAQADDIESAFKMLVRQLSQDGFEPAIKSGSRTDLMHCPFADVASTAPGVVCELHRGLIDGYLSGQASPIVGELQIKDPHRAGCRVTIGAPK